MPNTQPAQQPVIPSGGGLERVYALLPAQRPAPLIPVYLAAALIACQVVMWQVLACNILFTVQYPINALSESQAKAMEQIQQYYPALVTGHYVYHGHAHVSSAEVPAGSPLGCPGAYGA